MALTSTIIKAKVELSDVDRGVYESFELKLAQHPSEENERLVVRLLARCLAHEADLDFGRGLSSTEEPALWIVESGDRVRLWIDVGAPAAERLHKASKRADRVKVFSDKDPAALKRAWQGEKIHQADQVEVVVFPRSLIDPLADGLGRSLDWTLTLMDGALTVTAGDLVLTEELARSTVAELVS